MKHRSSFQRVRRLSLLLRFSIHQRLSSQNVKKSQLFLRFSIHQRLSNSLKDLNKFSCVFKHHLSNKLSAKDFLLILWLLILSQKTLIIWFNQSINVSKTIFDIFELEIIDETCVVVDVMLIVRRSRVSTRFKKKSNWKSVWRRRRWKEKKRKRKQKRWRRWLKRRKER